MSQPKDIPSRAVPSLDTATTPEESHSPTTTPEETPRWHKAGLVILGYLSGVLIAISLLALGTVGALSTLDSPARKLAAFIACAVGIGGLALRAWARHLSRRQARQQALRLHARKVAELKAGPATQLTWAEGAAFLLWRDSEITSDQLASLRPWVASFGVALRRTHETSRTPDEAPATPEETFETPEGTHSTEDSAS